MDENTKSIFNKQVTAVMTGTLQNAQNVFKKHKLMQDKRFLDYKLLKLALARKHIGIVKLLLKLGCRVTTPNRKNSEESAFHLAIKMDNADIVEKMLKNGASIDDKNENGDTALYIAFIGNHFNAVHTALTFLVNSFDDIKTLDPTNVHNIRHFQIACVVYHYGAVHCYLKYKFDISSSIILNYASLFGLNLLTFIYSRKNLCGIFKIFLEKGDFSKENSNGITPLQFLFYSRLYECAIDEIFRKGNQTKFINSVDDNGVSHFHICCIVNNPEITRVFIDNGVDVNSSISSDCSNYPGYTPLHFAVEYGCEKVVQLLLESGANCNEKNTESSTPLHLACRFIFYDRGLLIIEMLLKYNACPAITDGNNNTPLHLAFRNFNFWKETKILDMLILKMPKEVNLIDENGLSYFHIVSSRNAVSRVCDFLQSGVDINETEIWHGYTALHLAALFNHKDVVKMLLQWNAQVNIKTIKKELTPLHLACNFGNKKFDDLHFCYSDNNLDWISNCKNQLDIIKLLLLHGADIEAQDAKGKTPLLSTCTFDSNYYGINSSDVNKKLKEIIGILLLNKANINAQTFHRQESVLHIIIEKTKLATLELVEYLLIQGANVHTINNLGFTPLHVAVKFEKNKLVKILLKHQADVNAKNSDGLIPLEMIVTSNTYFYHKPISRIIPSNDIVSTLLENDSYVNVINERNESLLQIAVQFRNIFVIKQLLDYGADINMEDSRGNSSVSSLFKWEEITDGNIHFLENNEIFAIIFQIVFIHVQKLSALGLYVSKKVQWCCMQLYQQYQKALLLPNMLNSLNDYYGIANLDNIFDSCAEELNKMKLVKIDNYTSLYDILLKNAHEMSKHINNRKFVKIFCDLDVNNNFPLYGFLLKLKNRNGLKRSKVLNLAKEALLCVIKLDLPDLCCDTILKFLSNEDVVNLKAAAKNNYKRKLSSEDSSDTKTSAKLSK